MKDESGQRKTKKDKARKNFERYGKYTPKHVRMQEELAEKRQLLGNSQLDKKSKKDNKHK
jgi:hypothetical protein